MSSSVKVNRLDFASTRSHTGSSEASALFVVGGKSEKGKR